MNNKKYKIGGKFFKINIENNLLEKFGLDKDSEEIYGCIDYANSDIYIDNNMSPDSKQEAIVHELLHALLDRKNLELISKNSTIEEVVENIVEYLTPRFHSFFVDNPNFQKELLELLEEPEKE